MRRDWILIGIVAVTVVAIWVWAIVTSSGWEMG